MRRTLESHKGKYWLIFGVLGYLGAAIPSIVRSIEGTLGDNAYMAVDWLAACVIYFFLGAMLGHLVDWWFLREKAKHPLWFWLICGFWALSSIVVGLSAREGLLSPVLVVIFPLAFGIFLTGSAFTILAPSLVQKTLYGKLALDILYLALFGAWLSLATRAKRVTLARILLIAVFLVLFLGLAGCVRTLS